MNKKIDKRIREYSRAFDIDAQRAELISRNKTFLEELEAVKVNWHIGEFLEGRGKIPSEEISKGVPITEFTKNGSDSIRRKLDLLKAGAKEISKKEEAARASSAFETIWSKFCDRWNIRWEWDGDLKTLKGYLKPPVEILVMEGKEEGGPILFVRIDNWTRLNDLKKIWHDIENLQDRIWEKQEKKTNFSRDLCWYDLSKTFGLKVREIAEIWADKFPEETGLLVARSMKEEIDAPDLKGRKLTDKELLHEIQDGYLKKKYGTYFEEERIFYLTGKYRGKKREMKLNPPFVDAVKKALKRMDQQITKMGVSSLKISLDIKQALHFLKSYVDHSN